MTWDDWTGLGAYVVGGGLLGYCWAHTRDAWAKRPVIIRHRRCGHWVSARSRHQHGCR